MCAVMMFIANQIIINSLADVQVKNEQLWAQRIPKDYYGWSKLEFWLAYKCWKFHHLHQSCQHNSLIWQRVGWRCQESNLCWSAINTTKLQSGTSDQQPLFPLIRVFTSKHYSSEAVKRFSSRRGFSHANLNLLLAHQIQEKEDADAAQAALNHLETTKQEIEELETKVNDTRISMAATCSEPGLSWLQALGELQGLMLGKWVI